MSKETFNSADGMSQALYAAQSLTDAITESFQTFDSQGFDDLNVPSAIKKLSESICHAAREIGCGASHGPGALEFIGMQIRDQGERLSSSASEIAEAINNLADAIREVGRQQ